MARQPQLQIIALNYGGMARDAAVVTELASAQGWQVQVTWRTPLSLFHRAIQRAGLQRLRPPQFDLNIFMQQPEEWWLPQARHCVVIPNADWYTTYGVRLAPRIHEFWCKTREAVDIFGRLGTRSQFLGFTSMDPAALVADPPQRNWREPLHVAGSSALKGSVQVIEAWRRNPHWPTLNLLTSVPHLLALGRQVANIRVLQSLPSASDVAALQLRCGIHVQPSETEGYGHVLGESLASGAVVVSVDAPPMNELVGEPHGLVVAARPTSMHYLAQRYEFIEQDFDRVMDSIWEAPVPSLEARGRSARAWFVDNRTQFQRRFASLLATVPKA